MNLFEIIKITNAQSCLLYLNFELANYELKIKILIYFWLLFDILHVLYLTQTIYYL